MISGIVLLLLTGSAWVGIAVVVSGAARKGLDLDFIQAGAALLTALAAGSVLLFTPALEIPLARRLPVEAAIVAAGVGNYLMLKLMNAGMARGDNGAVWGITQSALLFPFLMGILCFGVAPTATRILGFILIIGAVVLFSFARRRPGKGGHWLLPTLGAFFCAGASQCCANLPSYLHWEGMSSPRRAFLVQLGVLGAFTVNMLVTRKRLAPANSLTPIVSLALINIVSLFFFFYRGLNRLAEAGAGSIGYPIAMGACIAGFFLYSRFRLREAATFASLLGFFAVLAGILIISL